MFGPFSTLLTAPSAAVAHRYGYAFIEPAGGGPAVFDQKLDNVFFTQPAPIVESGDVFANWILSLPKSQRPKTAAYPALDDPFSSPIADRIRGILEKAGVKTVYKSIYASETTDMTPIVSKIVAAKPDAIIGGTQAGDGYSLVKALVQAKYSPKFLFLANGPNSPGEFPGKVGPKNVNGIFSASDWFPEAKTPGNPAFVKAFLKAYGGTADAIDPGSFMRSKVLPRRPCRTAPRPARASPRAATRRGAAGEAWSSRPPMVAHTGRRRHRWLAPCAR